MGVPREDLLVMMRALKRGYSDVRAIRRALDRQISRPIAFLEALHLPAAELQALRADTSLPDPVQDRYRLDDLQAMLLEGEDLGPHDWEKFVASLVRASHKHEHPGLSIPQEFDGYTLQWELARRERGVVYRGKDREGREVAVKVFRPDVKAEGLPTVAGHAYAVGEFADGETLEAKRLSLRRGVEAVAKAAQILRDRPHGAVTPARVMVRNDDRVAVLGFEHAKAVGPSPRTLAYSGGSDLHSLGAILYEMIVGVPPAGETSPAARVRDTDGALDRIVSCALSGGYGSTGDLADDLARFLKGEPVTARKAQAPAAAKRRTWIWAAAAAVPLAGLVLYVSLRKGEVPAPKDEASAPAPAPRPPAPAPEPPKEDKKASAPRPAPAPASAALTAEEEQRLADACDKALAAEDYDRIVALANEAVARGSKKDWPLFYLTNAFIAKDELDKALQYVNRALEAAPGNRAYLELRGETHAFRGEWGKALADFGQLYGTKAADLNKQILKQAKRVEADPKDGRSRLLRGAFFYAKRHWESAEKDFTAAMDLGQRRALAWRAATHAGAEDRARAEADAKAFLGQFPSDFATGEVKALLGSLGHP